MKNKKKYAYIFLLRFYYGLIKVLKKILRFFWRFVDKFLDTFNKKETKKVCDDLILVPVFQNSCILIRTIGKIEASYILTSKLINRIGIFVSNSADMRI